MTILRKIKFGKSEKEHIFIKNKKIFIGISYFRNSNVRIADSNGNHLYKPREHKLEKSYFIEWMITNKEIALILKEFLNKSQIGEIVKKIKEINKFIEKKKKYTGRKIISLNWFFVKYSGFKIIPRFEKFYTFKKHIKKSKSFVEVTFKPGDVSPMEEHMYMLIPFSYVEFIHTNNKIKMGENILTPTYAVWNPTIEELEEIVITIAHTSEKHRDQLIESINTIF